MYGIALNEREYKGLIGKPFPSQRAPQLPKLNLKKQNSRTEEEACVVVQDPLRLPFRHVEIRSIEKVACSRQVFSASSQAFANQGKEYYKKEVADMQSAAGAASSRSDWMMKEIGLPILVDHVAKVNANVLLGSEWFGIHGERAEDQDQPGDAAAPAQTQPAAAERSAAASPPPPPQPIAAASVSVATPPPKRSSASPAIVRSIAGDRQEGVSVASGDEGDEDNDEKLGGAAFTKAMRKCETSRERLELLLRKLPLKSFLKGFTMVRESNNSQHYLTNGLLDLADIKLLRNHLNLVVGLGVNLLGKTAFRKVRLDFITHKMALDCIRILGLTRLG